MARGRHITPKKLTPSAAKCPANPQPIITKPLRYRPGSIALREIRK